MIMKSIKNIALSALLTVGAFGAVTYTACNKDECKDVVCQNGGTCSGGNCTCTTGYEGNRCETASRAKFIKTWTATDMEVGGSALPTYNAIITAGTSITDIKIAKFSDAYFINDVLATVQGNTITIASQAPDGDNYRVAGAGTFNAVDGKITWSYTITNPQGVTKSYTASWQ